MKKTTRLISAALVPALVAASLVACSKTNPPTTDTNENTDTVAVTQTGTHPDTPPVTEADTEAVIEETTVETTEETSAEDPISDRMELTSDVRIYCPTNRIRALKKLSDTLIDGIQEKTGITLTAVFDPEEAPADSEIIIGFDATREATAAAYRITPVGSYGVYTEGSSAVLAVWGEEDLQPAAELFLETCLTKEGDRWYIQSHVDHGDTPPPAVALSAYRIVYAANADDYLVQTLVPNLQKYLKDAYGVEVEAVSDDADPTPYELVLGNTNRTTEEVLPYLEGDTALRPYQRAVVSVENKFFILGHGVGEISLAFSRLMDRMSDHLIGQNNLWHTLAPVSLSSLDEPYVSTPVTTTDKAEVAEGTDLRVMSYNILNQDYVPNNPLPPERDEDFASVLLYYRPDVVGIQEANLAWHQSIDRIFGSSGLYLPACRYHDGKNTTQTSFLYNPLTVKLIDEYVIYFEDWTGSDIRMVSFAVFEKLEDGRRFVVTNTHPAPHAEFYDGHINEIIRIVNQETVKYEGLPVIMTGDFNTGECQSQYNRILSSLGMVDARYDEGVELVRNACTYVIPSGGQAVGGSITEANNNNLDHIFINDKLDALLFNVVVDHNVVNISDHLPIYADLVWK